MIEIEILWSRGPGASMNKGFGSNVVREEFGVDAVEDCGNEGGNQRLGGLDGKTVGVFERKERS